MFTAYLNRCDRWTVDRRRKRHGATWTPSAKTRKSSGSCEILLKRLARSLQVPAKICAPGTRSPKVLRRLRSGEGLNTSRTTREDAGRAPGVRPASRVRRSQGQFATVTLTLFEPVRVVESVRITVMVCPPFGKAVVFHGIEVGESAHVCCATWVPSTLMVQFRGPCALWCHTMTQLVPLTLSPFRGCVTSTFSGVFDTLMLTLAVPVRGVESVSVTVRVRVPLLTALVFHGIDVGESAHVCCATCVPSTVIVQVGVPWKLWGHTMTQLVPLTVSPFRGCVMSIVSGVVVNCSAAMAVPQPSMAVRMYSPVTQTISG